MDIKHLNKYDKKVITNGYRPAWLSEKMSKSIEKALAPFFNLIFKDCCDCHDIAFYFGTTKVEFKQANKKFYKCMKRAIKKNSSWYSRWFYYYKAWQYYKLVSKFGWGAFTEHAIKNMDIDELPSYSPYKDLKITVRTVWVHNRWWTRKEAIKTGLIKGDKHGN